MYLHTEFRPGLRPPPALPVHFRRLPPMLVPYYPRDSRLRDIHGRSEDEAFVEARGINRREDDVR